jgi:hypothetical protein
MSALWRVAGKIEDVGELVLWRGAFRIFPQLARNQLVGRLRQATLPPDQAAMTQQMIEYQSQIVLPLLASIMSILDAL